VPKFAAKNPRRKSEAKARAPERFAEKLKFRISFGDTTRHFNTRPLQGLDIQGLDTGIRVFANL
jgi:hypothetical protein